MDKDQKKKLFKGLAAIAIFVVIELILIKGILSSWGLA